VKQLGAAFFLSTNITIVPLNTMHFCKLELRTKLADHVNMLEIIEQLSDLEDIILNLD
jgi:hypothetical protein